MKLILSKSELLKLIQKYISNEVHDIEIDDDCPIGWHNELTKILIEFRASKIDKIPAIKKVRMIAGCDLLEAKSFIEIASSIDIIHISPLIHKHGVDAYKYI